jgi:hypothetical protein
MELWSDKKQKKGDRISLNKNGKTYIVKSCEHTGKYDNRDHYKLKVRLEKKEVIQ